ncbi:MAG TPA: N-acetylmuramoyl-L-alanine amidase [Chthoniobacterales bacterium]|jgi:N-acetylmuramoyl-L-alanine amidase|nr:N-acetylmuramoyl-L-alanine amidase [Chthoniobacterales bacterium]
MREILRSAHWRGISLGKGSALLLALCLWLPTAAKAARHTSFRTVVIDPGHGGFDRGGIPGQRVAEKTMALDVALRVAKKLRSAGYDVIMTRDSDVFVTLGGRVAIANAHPNAVFVCIHFNSATRSGANGIETYYYHNDSARLAANIHRQVVAGTETDNRGIRRRGYFVLRRTRIPAILVECGFLTNPTEARLALQSSYRDRLAERIADGVEGKPTPYNRPVVAGLTHIRPPIGQPFGYNDFVSAQPEHHAITHHTRHSSSRRRHHHTSKKKKSSSSSKKKKSSSKKKKKKKSSSD